MGKGKGKKDKNTGVEKTVEEETKKPEPEPEPEAEAQTEAESEAGAESEKVVPEKSDTRKRLYAILCILLGTFEYVVVMSILAIVLIIGGRLVEFGLKVSADEILGYVSAFLTYILTTLWMRRRYAKGVKRTVGPCCWNIVIPSVLLVVLVDLFVVLDLRWIDQSMGLGLVPCPENVTQTNPLDVAIKCVLAPLCEEFIFRFALVLEAQKLAGTTAEISPRIQGAISGIAFGLIHLAAAVNAGESPVIVISHLCFAACFGVAMTYLDGAAGNRLWPSIICHICNNILVVFLPLNVAVTEWRSIAVLAGAVLIQSAVLVGMSFIPVPSTEIKEHEHSN